MPEPDDKPAQGAAPRRGAAPAPAVLSRQFPRGNPENSGRATAAAVGLSLAAIVPAILVASFPQIRELMRPPSAACLLTALLILAPAGVGLAAALSGLPRILASLRVGDGALAEQAVLRIFAVTALFASVAGAAMTAPDRVPEPALPAAAIGLVAAWAALLGLILRPPGAAWARRCGTALDLALLSTCLHLGGGAAAGGYPVYLLLIGYAGFRFGERALIESALGSLAGFGIVVLTTGFWRHQAGLASGLSVMLLVLPAGLAGLFRTVAAARADAAAAEADRLRSLRTIADALQTPLSALGAQTADRPMRAVSEHISGVLDLVAIETGAFSTRDETFDLRALINDTLAPLSVQTAERGVALRWRIDPRLPSRLRGQPQAIARILAVLVGHFVRSASAGTLWVALDMLNRRGDQISLRLRIGASDAIDAVAEPGKASAEWEGEAVAVAVAGRLARLIGGELDIEGRTEGRAGLPAHFAVRLTLGIEQRAGETDLDLCDQPVLVVTEDENFAGELILLLDRWRAAARWVGGAEKALAELGGFAPGSRPVLIVDGRDRPLAALAFAENLRRLAIGEVFALFVGESSRIERLLELDETAWDCLLPAPVTERLLVNAFRGLPLAGLVGDSAARAGGAAELDISDAQRDAPRRGRVTPIAAHPKFGSETAVVDNAAIDALRRLSNEEPFLLDLIEAFAADAQQLLRQLERAAANADAAAFSRSVAALRRCARNLGGARLCEVAASFAVSDADLRQRGELLVRQLEAETGRLVAALRSLPPAGKAAAG